MIKIVKATLKKYGWGMVGMLVGLGIVDIVTKEEFRLSTWGIRFVVMAVMYFICGAIEYKSGKLK